MPYHYVNANIEGPGVLLLVIEARSEEAARKKAKPKSAIARLTSDEKYRLGQGQVVEVFQDVKRKTNPWLEGVI